MPTPTRATAFLPIPAALLLLAGASGLPAPAKPGHLHNRTREVWFLEPETIRPKQALELTEPEPDCCSLL